MKSFKTPKGTELPFLNLHGQDYLKVPHRVLWFREDNTLWGIETEVINLNERIAVFKTTIKDKDGRVIATGHGSETAQGYKDYVEKAETVSVGRALGFAGFGTQFALELIDEGKLSDSPIESKKMNERRVFSENKGTLNQVTVPKVSEKQINRLHAIRKKADWSEHDLIVYLKKIGLTKPEDLNSVQYNHLCNQMEQYPKERSLAPDGARDFDKHLKSLS